MKGWTTFSLSFESARLQPRRNCGKISASFSPECDQQLVQSLPGMMALRARFPIFRL